MKEPVELPVKAVQTRHIAPGNWECDVVFGIPADTWYDDPTITVSSGEGLEFPPKAGDKLLVRPPEIISYAKDLERRELQ